MLLFQCFAQWKNAYINEGASAYAKLKSGVHRVHVRVKHNKHGACAKSAFMCVMVCVCVLVRVYANGSHLHRIPASGECTQKALAADLAADALHSIERSRQQLHPAHSV